MVFKYPYLSKEFSLLCPKTLEIAWDLDKWLRKEAYADMMITHIFRTDKQQEDWYWQKKLEGLAGTSQASEEHARELARKSFSWHKVYCAFDMNNSRYDDKQKGKILAYLRNGRSDSCWEIYSHNVGQGPHFHVGYEDFAWRRKWEAKLIA